MKRIGVLVLLVLSLAANVVLLVAGRSGPAQGQPAARDPARAEPEEHASRASATDASTVPSAVERTDAFRGIQGADLAGVRDQLRAAGIPEEYVRAVIWERIRRSHHAQREALAARLDTPYWMARDRALEAEIRAAERELDRAERDAFERYFAERYGDVSRARQTRARLSFLPGDKAEEATRITSDYAELQRQVMEEMMNGAALEEDQQKMALIEEERRADLGRLLSADELELFELHTSQTASSMRSRLALFEPSEQEFRAIFSLQNAFDAEFGWSFRGPSREETQARSAAQSRLNDEIRSVLGPDRYAEYQRATSLGFQAAVKIADHYDLPREQAAKVYALEAEYRDRLRGVPPAQRAAAAQTAFAEANARVVELLGEKGATAFRAVPALWLSSLEAQAKRAAGNRPPP